MGVSRRRDLQTVSALDQHFTFKVLPTECCCTRWYSLWFGLGDGKLTVCIQGGASYLYWNRIWEKDSDLDKIYTIEFHQILYLFCIWCLRWFQLSKFSGCCFYDLMIYMCSVARWYKSSNFAVPVESIVKTISGSEIYRFLFYSKRIRIPVSILRLCYFII